MGLYITVAGMESIVAGTAWAGAAGAGAIVGLIAFIIEQAMKNRHAINYYFKIGLDGAGTNMGVTPLQDAGGFIPGIRIYDNLGRYMGHSNPDIKCKNGEDHCKTEAEGILKQPSYALIMGQKDAVCVAAVAVEYPSGDRYAWVGNWANTCGQSWYYSDIDARTENGSTKLFCAWIGPKGYERGYATAIRIHWPEFSQGFAGNGNNEKYYCQANNTALQFYDNKQPRFFDGLSKLQKQMHDKKIHEVEKSNKKIEKQSRVRPHFFNPDPPHSKRQVSNGKVRRSISEGMEKRMVQSHHDSHSARFLCDNESSVGPSLASMTERRFCHMPDKVLYPFCEDIPYGACWDHNNHRFDKKGGSVAARAALPNIEFEKPMVWGKKA